MAEEVSTDAHKSYDLDPVDDRTVWIMCATCREPLGLATVLAWGLIAEAHYRDKVAIDGRP